MGFPGLTCIKCGHADCVSLDLDDCKTFRCRECDDEFTTVELADHLDAWRQALAWVETAPQAIARRVA